MDITFSIIVPVYNRAHCLADSVQSVLKQTYSNYELILVNDGSTDASGSICDKFAEEHDRIRVIHSTNFGVSHARNLGIEAARGQYIVFLDSDDQLSENYLKGFFAHIEQADLLMPQVEEVVIHNGEMTSKFRYYDKSKFAGLLKDNYQYIPHLLSLQGGKLYRRDILQKYHIRYNESLSVSEDQYFNFQYYEHIHTYKIVEDIAYQYYRTDQGTLSFTYTDKYFEDELKRFQLESNYLDSNDIVNRDVIYWDHIISIIDRYAYVKSSHTDGWSDYKSRIQRLISIRPIVNVSLSNKKRNYIFWLLRHNLYEVVMAYYRWKHRKR